MSLPDDVDRAAFAAAMAGVRRLHATHLAAHERQPPSVPHPRQTEADERAVMAELLAIPENELLETGDTLLYRIDGVQEGVMRKLRRGQYHLDAELDLHGCNRERAQQLIVQFLAHCQDRRHRCVRIIHGKGNRSPNSGPVLKAYVASWLRRRQDVVAYCSARPSDGGTGAVYVLLRATRSAG